MRNKKTRYRKIRPMPNSVKEPWHSGIDSNQCPYPDSSKCGDFRTPIDELRFGRDNDRHQLPTPNVEKKPE
jgi:hypothetical protein